MQNQPDQYKIYSNLRYQINGGGALLLNIQAAHTPEQTILNEQLTIEPVPPFEQLEQANGSRWLKLVLDQTTDLSIHYEVTVRKENELLHQSPNPIAIGDYPAEALTYLFPSRYCPSDRVEQFATDLFGNLGTVEATVTAIVNWIKTNISYLGGITDAHSTALDVILGRRGVCRDFAHLGILFCRAMNIPARYFTGYAYLLEPQDFHACFEAWMGDRWQIFDATGLAPIDGLIRIGTGMDAADTSFANLFGNVNFQSMEVSVSA